MVTERGARPPRRASSLHAHHTLLGDAISTSSSPPSTRDRLIRAGTELIRRDGYVGTTVDAICTEAGVTKGAFFHHFASKEALALTALKSWGEALEALHAGAPYQSIDEPVARLAGCLEFHAGFFTKPGWLKSCLAGTTAQEVSATHPDLRDAAQNVFLRAGTKLAALIEKAAASTGRDVDAQALAELWMGTIQGALVLAKASGDESGIERSLTLVRQLIADKVGEPLPPPPE